jgi:CelD/BcsL family acetyltransferase involved in cellulose biosynthesis
MKIVRQLDEHRWREFVACQPQGNVFHTPEMFQVFRRAEGFAPALWAAESGDGRILALLLPVEITLLGNLFRHVSTRSVAYGSVLCADDAEGMDGLDLLLKTYVRESRGVSLFTELRNLSDMDPYHATLNRNGFLLEDHLNFLINLDRSPDELLQNIGHRTRKVIRRGLRSASVAMEDVRSLEGIAECYGILARTFEAAHVPLAPFALFEAAHDLLLPQGMVKFTLARIDGAPVATSVELLYKKTVFGWYGGVERSYCGYAPNEMLTWHILEWGAKNGYAVYDFGGAGRPDEKYGVRDFKAKFGGTLVNFGRHTCVHAPCLLRLSRIGYSLVRGSLSKADKLLNDSRREHAATGGPG